MTAITLELTDAKAREWKRKLQIEFEQSDAAGLDYLVELAVLHFLADIAKRDSDEAIRLLNQQ